MKLTDYDFDSLWDTRYSWRHGSWKDQVDDGRFTAIDGKPINLQFEKAIFVRHPASFILCRQYLEQESIPYQPLSDDNMGGYVILCDLCSPS